MAVILFRFNRFPHSDTSQCHQNNPTLSLSTWPPHKQISALLWAGKILQLGVQEVFGNESFYCRLVNKVKWWHLIFRSGFILLMDANENWHQGQTKKSQTGFHRIFFRDTYLQNFPKFTSSSTTLICASALPTTTHVMWGLCLWFSAFFCCCSLIVNKNMHYEGM